MNVFVMLCGSIVVTYINLDYVMRKKKCINTGNSTNRSFSCRLKTFYNYLRMPELPCQGLQLKPTANSSVGSRSLNTHTHTDTHLHCEEVHFGTKILHLPFLLPPYVTILLTQCFSTLQRGTEKADSRFLLFYLEANIS